MYYVCIIFYLLLSVKVSPNKATRKWSFEVLSAVATVTAAVSNQE